MKAMILAAGKGERLGKLVSHCPKVMLAVGNKTILEHNLHYLKRAGFRDVAINLFYRPEAIRGFLKEKRHFGLRITFSHEKRLLGTAGALRKMARYFRSGDFLVLYGDNLMDFDVRKLISVHKRTAATVTIGVYRPSQTKSSGMAAGLVQADRGGKVVRFLERRGNRTVASPYWVNAGIYVASPAVLKLIPKKKACDFGKDLFPQLLRKNYRLQIVDGAHYVLASDDLDSLSRTRKIFGYLTTFKRR